MCSRGIRRADIVRSNARRFDPSERPSYHPKPLHAEEAKEKTKGESSQKETKP